MKYDGQRKFLKLIVSLIKPNGKEVKEMDARTEELERLAMPLFKFLKENYHPHTKIEISDLYIKVLEDTICIPKNNGQYKPPVI